MGLFADIKAMSDVQKIKLGGRAAISISSITTLIINLPDAQKNLSAQEYANVYSLYKKMRKCTTKLDMDLDGYYRIAADILREFDKISPCEPYLGLEPFEAALLMQEIRQLN